MSITFLLSLPHLPRHLLYADPVDSPPHPHPCWHPPTLRLYSSERKASIIPLVDITYHLTWSTYYWLRIWSDASVIRLTFLTRSLDVRKHLMRRTLIVNNAAQRERPVEITAVFIHERRACDVAFYDTITQMSSSGQSLDLHFYWGSNINVIKNLKELSVTTFLSVHFRAEMWTFTGRLDKSVDETR